MRKGLFTALAIGVAIACALFFVASYRDAKAAALAALRDEQRLHARQAALGIEDFFATWTSTLNALSRTEEAIHVDADGRHDLQLFFEAHREQIRSISRVDERGVIVLSFPFGQAEGSDISSQKHIRQILLDHRPVASDVFRTVQGFDGIALHVPVFEGTAFKGTIGVVFDFASLARRYFDVIRVGRTGSAWVLSRDGTLLYGPVAGLSGKPSAESLAGSPSVAQLFAAMREGREGSATYTLSRVEGRPVAPSAMFAVYMPIKVGGTFWSVAVSSSEQELLASLDASRNRLALIVGLLFVGGMLFAVLAARAWLVVREGEARRKAEDALRASEESFRRIVETAREGIWQIDAELETTFVNRRMAEMLGYTPAEMLGKTPFDFMSAEARDEAEASLEGGKLSIFESRERRFQRKDGSEVWTILTGNPLAARDGGYAGALALVTDITVRRRAEGIREAAYRISAAGESARSLGEFFKLAHEIVGSLIPASNFYVALLDRLTGTLSFPYFVDEVDPPPAPRPLGRGLTEYVLRTGEPLLATPEVFDDLVTRGEVEPLGGPSVDWLGAPLKVAGMTIGAVVVQTYSPGIRYGAPDASFLSFISSQLAMAIERKRVEAEIRHAMAYNRSLIEASLDPIVTIGPDGRITDVNRATETITGLSRDQLVGADFADSFTEPARARAGFEQAYREGKVNDYPLDIKHRDGRVTSVLYNASIYRDSSGRPAGVFASARDVSDRKRAESEREALLEIMLGLVSTPDPRAFLRLVHQAVSRVIYAENFFVLLRAPRSDLFEFLYIADRYDEASPPTDLGRSLSAYVYRTGEAMFVTQESFERLKALGEVEDVGTPSPSWLGAPLKKGNRAIGVMAVQDYETPGRYSERDRAFLSSVAAQVAVAIERQKAEQALKGSEERFRRVFEDSAVGMVRVGHDLRFLDTNEAFSSFIGYSREELASMTYRDIATPDRVADDLDGVTKLIRGEIGVLRTERRYVRKDGTLVWGGLSVSAVRDDSGGPPYFVGMVEEIGDRKRAEEAVKRLNADLEERVAGRTAELESAVKEVEKMHDLAYVDSLTGLGNRRYAEARIRSSLEESQRHGWPLGLLFVDIDRFKVVNDVHGHEAGDAVLRKVGSTLRKAARSSDFVGRWGGEEFVVLATNTGPEDLGRAAERLRTLVSAAETSTTSGPISVTVSIGAASFVPGDSLESLVARADELMYRAKRAGRDCVVAGS